MLIIYSHTLSETNNHSAPGLENGYQHFGTAYTQELQARFWVGRGRSMPFFYFFYSVSTFLVCIHIARYSFQNQNTWLIN